jgi:site-specific recombinase
MGSALSMIVNSSYLIVYCGRDVSTTFKYYTESKIKQRLNPPIYYQRQLQNLFTYPHNNHQHDQAPNSIPF